MRRGRDRITARRSGFTILELMVAFFISMAVFSLVITLFLRVTDFRRRTQRSIAVVRTAGGVFSLMERDLNGAYAAETKFHVEDDPDDQTDQLEFWTSTDNRYDTDPGTPGIQADLILRVRYRIQEGVLYREFRPKSELGFQTQVLARGVESFGVEAYDNSNALIPAGDLLTLPRYVKLSVRFYTDRGYDTDGDGQVSVTERLSYFDTNGNGLPDTDEINRARVAGRLRPFTQIINLPAGGGP